MIKKRFIANIAVVIVLIVGMIYALSDKIRFAENSTKEIEISFLNQNNDADCTIIRHGNEAIIIDTGEPSDGAFIVDTLKEYGIENIPFLILTHPDKDHIGGANEILNHFNVEQVIVPMYNKKNDMLEEVYQTIYERKINLTVLLIPRAYNFGEMTFTVFPPNEKNYHSDNNYSLAILVNHGTINMFFAGDAEKKRTRELLAFNLPQVNLYKVAHHGRSNKCSKELLDVLCPQYAIVTSSDADSIIKDTVAAQGGKMFYTLKQAVKLISDGENLRMIESSS